MANCHAKREMGVEPFPMVGVHFFVYHFSESYPILSAILPFGGMHNQPPQTGIQVSDSSTDALCHQKSSFSGVFRHRSVPLRPGVFFMQVEDDLAARRLQRRPSRDFFLADESWEGIFCGVVIPDRGMITYSTFIVGIPIVTMPIRSFFKGSILIPSLLLNPHAIKSV